MESAKNKVYEQLFEKYKQFSNLDELSKKDIF